MKENNRKVQELRHKSFGALYSKSIKCFWGAIEHVFKVLGFHIASLKES